MSAEAPVRLEPPSVDTSPPPEGAAPLPAAPFSACTVRRATYNRYPDSYRETSIAVAVTIFNRKARFDFEILETVEAGIELKGTEVKSVRAGKVSLVDSFARIRNGEMFLFGAEISPYEKAGYAHHAAPRQHRSKGPAIASSPGFTEGGGSEIHRPN